MKKLKSGEPQDAYVDWKRIPFPVILLNVKEQWLKEHGKLPRKGKEKRAFKKVINDMAISIFMEDNFS